jgi:hypothetical protein
MSAEKTTTPRQKETNMSCATEPTYKSLFLQCKDLERKEREIQIMAATANARGPLWEKYHQLESKELLHITHVRSMMKILTGEDNNHDWSKTPWYFFITIGKFSLGESDLIGKEFERIVGWHTSNEDHHPEWVEHNGRLPEDRAILEMAIDRCSRNVQFNQGRWNGDQMRKFAPKFPLCPHHGATAIESCDCINKLLDLYWINVERVRELARDEWSKLMVKPAPSQLGMCNHGCQD